MATFVGRPSSEDYQAEHPGKQSGKQSGDSPRLHVHIPRSSEGLSVRFDFKLEKKIERVSFWLGHHNFKLVHFAI